jgi:23S rRNA pseudouridine1911/1915/1917 synthase
MIKDRYEAYNHAKNLLEPMRRREIELRNEALHIAFRSRQNQRLSIEEVAKEMALPLSRVKAMVARAMREYPMPPDPHPIDILFEDESLIFVSKPPGIITAPVHRYKIGSMLNRMIHYLGSPPFILHRLDMDTSGVLMFAKDKSIVEHMAAQFRHRTAQKTYLAICVGIPQVKQGEESIEIRAPIGRHPDPEQLIARVTYPEQQEVEDAEDRISSDDDGESQADGVQSAWTTIRVLSTSPDFDLKSAKPGLLFAGKVQDIRGCALVACSPHTGRTHQIRVHMQHIGSPLVGDELYGVQGPWIGRQALHAYSLCVKAPAREGMEEMSVTAPLPADFVKALEELGLQELGLLARPEV